MAVAVQPPHVANTSPVPERRKKDSKRTSSPSLGSNPTLYNSEFFYQTKEIIHETLYALLLEQGVKLNGYTIGQTEPVFASETNRKVYHSLKGACRYFMRVHSEQIRKNVEQLDISESTLCMTFHRAMHAMFSDGTNWGRIVALISFAVLVANKAHKASRVAVIESIEGWLTNFISQNLHGFIMKQKGWVS